MSSVVKYNGQCLSPVQAYSINKEASVLPNGQCVRPVFNISIEGTLMANYGSPTSNGSFGCFTDNNCETIPQDEWFDSLSTKQCALYDLFKDSYKPLELGTQFTAYPRVTNVSINDTTNPQLFTYSISLEADDIYCDGDPLVGTGCPGILSYEDNWDINYDEAEYIREFGQNRLFKISHNFSAVGVGIRGPDGWIKSPFDCARDFVKSNTGSHVGIENKVLIDGVSFTGDDIIMAGTHVHKLYNYYESHSFDNVTSSYTVSESWIAATGDFIESYTVDINDDSSSICPAVTIQGTIRGFDLRTNGAITAGNSRYDAAKEQLRHLIVITGFHERAEDISGYTLQVEPMSSTITKNIFTGEVTYNYSFKKLPKKMLPETKMEKIVVSHNWDEDIFAIINILGKGEIIQPIGGKRINTTSLSIDAVYPCRHLYDGSNESVGVSPFAGDGILSPRFYVPMSGSRDYAQDLQNLVSKYKNAIIDRFDPEWIVVDSQSENFDRNDGSYQYSLTWKWQMPGICE